MRNWVKRHKNFMVLMGIILLMTYFTVFGERGIFHLRRLESDLKNTKIEIERISKRNEKLKQKIHLLQNDEHYIGQIARKELGMVGEDEVIYKKVK